MSRGQVSIFVLAGAVLLLLMGGAGWMSFSQVRTGDLHGTMHGTMMDHSQTHEGMMGTAHRWMHGGTSADTSRNEDSLRANIAEASDTTGKGDTIVLETGYESGLTYRGANENLRDEDNPTLEIQAGEPVTLRLVNTGGGPHDFVIPSLDVSTETISRGEVATVTFVTEKAGEYTYYCSVPGHRASGMEGQIVIR